MASIRNLCVFRTSIFDPIARRFRWEFFAGVFGVTDDLPGCPEGPKLYMDPTISLLLAATFADLFASSVHEQFDFAPPVGLKTFHWINRRRWWWICHPMAFSHHLSARRPDADICLCLSYKLGQQFQLQP
ncbi:hypothetical protein ACMFMF_003122 [Clarireedia jacksonii]